MRKTKVTILGYYGGGNLGDELILSTILHALQKAVKKSDITVVSVNPVLTALHHNVEAISFKEKIRLIKILLTTRLFILGGGGLLKPQTTRYFSLWLILFKFFGSKTIMLSVGTEFIHSFGRLDKIMILIASRFTDIISVRDRITAKFLKSLGIKRRIHLTNDLTFLLYQTINKSIQDVDVKKPTECSYIVLCLREFRYTEKVWRDVQQKFDFTNFKKIIINLCEHLIKDKGMHIYFFVTQVGFETDENITQEIIKEINDKSKVSIVKSTISFKRILSLFKNSSCVISMRLHPLIITVLAGSPILGIAYSDKIKNFLTHNGFERFLFEPKEFMNNDSLRTLVDYILYNAPTIKQIIRKKAEKCYIQSLGNLHLLRDVLS